MSSQFDLEENLFRVVEALNKKAVPYALCGGLALAVHGHARATKDIDLLVPPEHVLPALDVLSSVGFTLRAGPIPLGVKTQHPQRLFRATKVGNNQQLTVDLLEVSSSYAPSWDSRRTLEWKRQPLTVVSSAGLIAMKRLSTRLKDRADIEVLEGAPDGRE